MTENGKLRKNSYNEKVTDGGKPRTYSHSEKVAPGVLDRRRSSALEAQGFPTITEPNIDDAVIRKKKSVKRVFGYPISIPFIIANEFCERFSYYGMRTILTIYLTDKLMMGDNEATDWYHEFVALCYATPLLGAIIADVFIGKYLTIMILSMVYCTGNAVMALSSIGKLGIFQESVKVDPNDPTLMVYQPKVWGALLGLHLIALGTGGIKPCVSSFGGDQFQESESSRLQKFFSLFYFSINAGSTIATILTPEVRATKCMGEATCFPLAFGIPALFMVIAVVAFVVASPWYIKVPPKGNPIVDVAKVCLTWMKSSTPGTAEIEYGSKKVEETKQLFRVLAIFIPFPFFWALFEQQGSRWIVQAKRMNGDLGGFELKPDQMQVFNPILIMALIPIFEFGVYPLMKKIGLPTTSLFRMMSGMMLVALSFIVCAFVELSMEQTVKDYNAAHSTTYDISTLPKEHQIHLLSTLPQIFLITCGEILCSITGLEFAYAYAPPSMKSVCQSFFLLTNAFGNVVVIVFTKITSRDLYRYFMWAGIQIAAAGLMYIISSKIQSGLDAYKQRNIAEAETLALEMKEKNPDTILENGDNN